MNGLDELHLGKTTAYKAEYDPGLLTPIPRSVGREALSIVNPLPFTGWDLWTAYEVSWLDSSGKPHVAIAEFTVPASSECIIESKSLKLYLNSLNQTRYESWHQVESVITQDLSACANAPVVVVLFTLDACADLGVVTLPGDCIDGIETIFSHYLPAPQLLKLEADGEYAEEVLYSHLLKTNCPVTGQPDWASVLIEYSGAEISRESILKYIVSFRDEQDFHEQCVERIYTDIMSACQPEKLTVYARYTRRGGIDINPLRSNQNVQASHLRLSRQ